MPQAVSSQIHLGADAQEMCMRPGLELPQLSPCLPCPGRGGPTLAGRSSATPYCPQTRNSPSLKTS